MKILGIFTCYNRKEKTISCLESLIKQNETIEFKFIAVDDASTDGTAEALDMIEQVILVRGEGDLYYSGGMRKGIDIAKKKYNEYDYYLLFNDDVEFLSNSIEKLLSFNDGKKRVAVGATCDSRGELSYGGIVKRSKYRPAFQMVMSDEKIKKCDTFNANCVMIPQEIFFDTPNIDPVFTHSMGDFDYGFGIKKQGYDIVVSDFFVGICNDNPVEKTWRNTKLSRSERLQLKKGPKGLPTKEWYYFVKKNYGIINAWYSSVIPFIRILLKK